MELGYRHPMGPLRLTDLVGLDVRLDIARNLARAYGERFAPPQLLVEKVAAGELGRKSGRGFYDWSGGPVPDWIRETPAKWIRQAAGAGRALPHAVRSRRPGPG